ncbi:(Fe-S)-binding protein [Tahibacter harae]|uniref:Glycolate oxidase iron-sulfur subunit n=1 Tax=Tahibacter harae TaxID=2963937 RepID=A0ABT1QN19_9GAMM|nr:(Fe-S)-binding protein [Tahibacter harae]MCQ4163921.1 (Fe-S)-binding protein [Tahibacter harae]
MSATSPAREAAASIVALADQCVLCGLCLPACPTYTVARSEAESPRGRISLARALAGGTLAAEGPGLAHLEHCLGCLSCERVCPSGVQYGRLITAARQAIAAPPGRHQQLLYVLAARPRWIRRLAALARGLRLRRWLQPVLRRSRWKQAVLTRGLSLLPPRAGVLPRPQATASLPRGRIGLFLGCFASAFDRDTHAAARLLLQALGYAVVEPAGQACCGALARHAGHTAPAQQLAMPTREAFLASGVDTVLVSASGCYGTLQEFTFADTPLQVREISEFLVSDAAFAALEFAPLAVRAALHLPCSLNNRVRAAATTRQLLQRIPQLDVQALPAQPACCGAGGTHMLTQPQLADALRDQRIAQVQALAPHLLLTSNIGCRLHLGAGVPAVEILHPITLLARQLKAAPTGLTGRQAD